MSTFVGIPPFSNPLWVAMETMHFHIAQTIFFQDTFVLHPGVQMNHLAPMKSWGGEHGNLNWMPGYYTNDGGRHQQRQNRSVFTPNNAISKYFSII